jgi:thymidylate kinase
MSKIYCVEGINGSGKTTVGRLLADKLSAEFVRLPQEGKIRDILVNDNLSSNAKLHLYLADMAEWYATRDKSKTYVLDRSYISTLTYQSLDGVNPEIILKSIDGANIYVDEVLYFEIDPQVAQARRITEQNKQGGNPGGYANRELEFYHNLSKEYEFFIDRLTSGWGRFKAYKVDAEKSIEEVLAQCLAHLNK